MNQEDEIIKQLKSILMEDELKKQEELMRQIELLKTQLNKNQNELRDNLAELTQPVISKTVQNEIRQSQDTLVDALQPLMGKMVRKSIQDEFAKLTERIDGEIDKTFSWNNIKQMFISFWEGVKKGDLVLKNINQMSVEEVYVIEQDSGLIIATYSKGNIIDQDLIASMLTAIKSFIEDAFKQKTGHLDSIEYDNFRIILQNYTKYYVAIVASGTVSATSKDLIIEKVIDFAQRHLSQSERPSEDRLNTYLAKYFENFDSNINIDATSKQKSNFDWKFWRW
ncbi:MAG: hypothetical protein EAZ55_14770 [Cytophagales bacterium]|nr:MAG: hypothetical protein EAZ55_14770 [Cytophagales bacterium]